jgi:hypothetical protein
VPGTRGTRANSSPVIEKPGKRKGYKKGIDEISHFLELSFEILTGILNFGSLWQERETQRKEGQLDDLLVIDGRPFDEDSDQILQPSQLRTTSMAPSIDYDSRVD